MTDDEEFLQHMDTQPLTFGKHRGETPEQIAKHSPSYIRWMYESIRPRVCSAKLNLAVDTAIQADNLRREQRPRRVRMFGGGGHGWDAPEKGGGGYGFDDVDDDIPF